MTVTLGGGAVTGSQVAAIQQPGYRSGAYYGSAVQGVASGVMAADIIYAIPVVIVRTVTIQSLALRVFATAAGVSGKGALYENLLTTGRLIAEANTTANMGAAPATIAEVTFATNPVVAPGIVWIAWKFNGAAQPVVVDTSVQSNVALWNMIGTPDAVPFIQPGSAVGGARRADAYANAMPSTFGAVTWTAGAPGAPASAWRAA